MLDRPHPPIAVDSHEVETMVAPLVTAKVLCGPGMAGPAAMSAVSLFFDPGQGHARRGGAHRPRPWRAAIADAQMTSR